MDALDYVQSVGDRGGVSRSAGVRFNYALETNSFMAQRIGGTTGLPTDDYYTIEFEYGVILRIKILSVPVESFTSKKDLIASNQRASLSSSGESEGDGIRTHRTPMASSRTRGPFFDPLKEDRDVARKVVSMKKSDGNESVVATRPPPPPASRFISHVPVFEDHQLAKPFVSHAKKMTRKQKVNADETNWSKLANTPDDAVTCWCPDTTDQPIILRFHTFMPATDDYTTWIRSIAQTVDTCFKYGKTHAIDNLIVDVRSNGGGMICAAIASYQMFNPAEWFFDEGAADNMYKIMMPYDLRKTPSIQKLVDHDQLNGDRNDPVTGEELKDYQWYDTSVWSDMHGVSGEFAAKTYFPGSCLFAFPLTDYVSNPIQPPFKKILIYTDGICGSACSLFITKLRYGGIGAILAKGGRPDEVIESASFSGGNVLEWDDVVAEYGSYMNIEYFPTNARARFNFNEMYAENQVIPREFMRLDPDYRLIDWDFDIDTAVDNIQPDSYEFSKPIKFFDNTDYHEKIAGNVLPQFRPPAVGKQGNSRTFGFDGSFCIAETGVADSRQVFMVQNGSTPWIVCSNNAVQNGPVCIQNDMSDDAKVVMIDKTAKRSCTMTWTSTKSQATLCCGNPLTSSLNTHTMHSSDVCTHTVTFSRMQCGGNPAPSNLRIGKVDMQFVEIDWDRSTVSDVLEYVLQYSKSADMTSPTEIVVSGQMLKTVVNGFEAGQKYYVRIAVKTLVGVGKWSDVVSFSTKSIRPIAVVQGGSQMVRVGDIVVFDGRKSYDPNSRSFGNTALQYTWSCTGSCDSYQNAITTANQQNSQQLQLTASSSSSSIVSVTVSLEVALKTDESVFASTSSVLKVIPNGSQMSPMEIRLIDGMFGGSSMISEQQPLRLWCETTGTPSIEWSAVMTSVYPPKYVYLPGLSVTGVNQFLLSIPGGKLKSGESYSFRLRDLNAPDANVTRDFSIIGSPQIGTIQIEPVTPGQVTPFTSMFRVSVNGWSSSRPLKYAFFVLFDQGGIEMRMPLAGGPSSSTSIQTTLPSPMPASTSEVVILVKAFDDVGGVAWSTKPFTLGPKVSTAGDTLTLAQDLHSSIDPKKPFSDISQKLTSLFLVLENAIDNKASLTNAQITNLQTLVRNVIDKMVEVVQNHSSALTNDMLNVMSSGVRTVIEYSDAVLKEDYLEKCLQILRAIYKLRSSEDIDTSSMQMSALDVSKIISIGKKVPSFKMSSAQETMNDITMGIAYQMRAGDAWKKIDGDTMFLGVVKMSRIRGLSEKVVKSDASNFGTDQPDVTFPDDFHTSCDPNNVFGDMTVKVAALTSQMYAANAERTFGSYQMSINVMDGNSSEIRVAQLANGVRIKLRKVTGTKTGSHMCMFYNHTTSLWSSEGVTKISEDHTKCRSM
eukprot:TRINITY_DN1852_c0_g1_i1.p1 TRINITY_DN1852_c0_g1~~TRINITY_DN1852_c0_g1_i1.p1  ORF type:complete len:1597 (-),score=406.78 TRINITY_DN1852_c0_g1_i1:558-4724(-)